MPDKITVTSGSLIFPGVNRRVEADPDATIADCIRLASIPERFHDLLRVWLDDAPIPRAWWRKVKPKPGHFVAIGMACGIDQFRGANGKETLQLAIPTLLQFGIFAGGMLMGAPGIIAGVASFGGGMIGSWISQNLIHVPEPVTNPEFTTIKAARNQARPYECIPRVYGRIRFAPPVAAMPVTSVEGQDQYLRVLLAPGYGPLHLTDFKIGDYEVKGARASRVEIEKRSLWNDAAEGITLFSRDVYEPAPVEKQLDYAEDWVDTESRAVRRPIHPKVYTFFTQTNTTEIGLDFLWPEGLYEDVNKVTNPYPVELAIRYRLKGATGANSWMYYAGDSSTFTPASLTNSVIYQRLTDLNDALDEITPVLDGIAEVSRTVSETVQAWFVPRMPQVDALLANNIAQGILTVDETTAAGNARTKIASLAAIVNTATVVSDLAEGVSDFNDNLSQLIFVLDTIDGIHRVIQYDRNNQGADLRTLPAWQRSIVYLFGLDWVVPTGGAGSFIVRTIGESRAPMWKSVSIKTPAGQYEVQVRRTTKNKYKDDKIHSRVQLFTYRSIIDDDIISEWADQNVALVALKVKATDDWNNQLDQVTMLCESPLYWHDGATWRGPDLYDDANYAVSRNPAWQMCDILRGGANDEPITDDDDLDLAKIREFAQYCNDNGYTCDIVFDRRTSAEEAMQTVCRCGKATPGKTGEGKYTVIIDRVQTTPCALITPRNSSGFSISKNMEERPHALRIQFQNADKDYQEDEAYVYADGYGLEHGLAEPTVIEDVELRGVTDPTKIKHMGRYFLACSTLRPEVFQTTLDVEQLVFERGDMVRIQHDTPMWGKGSARITALEVDGTRTFITLDEHPSAWEWATKTANAIRVRTSGNVLVYGEVCYDTGVDADRIYIEEPYPTNWGDVAVGDLLAIGALETETIDCIVRGIQPADELGARVTLIEHAPAVHDADDDIPEYDSRITLPYSPELAKPPRPEVIKVEVADAATVRQTDGTMAARILIGLRLPRGNTVAERTAAQNVNAVEVQYQRVGAERWNVMPAFTRDLTNVWVDGVEKGKAYNIRVRSVTKTGVPSVWFPLFNLTVLGKQARPPDVTGLRYENGVLTWGHFISPDFAGYEVRIVVGDGNTWDTAAPAHVGLLKSARFECPLIDRYQVEYFIKAFDTSGNESRRAAYKAVTLPPDKYFINLGGYQPLVGYYELDGVVASGAYTIVNDSGGSEFMYDAAGRPLYHGASGGNIPFYGTTYQAGSVTTPVHAVTIDASEESNANVTRDNTEFIWLKITMTSGPWRLLYRNTAKDIWPEDTAENFWPDDLDADIWPDHSVAFEVVTEKPRTPLHPDASDYGHQFRLEFFPSNTALEITNLQVMREFVRLEESGQGFDVADTGDVYLPITFPWQYVVSGTAQLSNDPDQNASAVVAVVTGSGYAPTVEVYDVVPARAEGVVDWHLVGF